MQYNKCKTCGACDGRAGDLINGECDNCSDTRKSGEYTVHANLNRTPVELGHTFGILDEMKPIKHTPGPWQFMYGHTPETIEELEVLSSAAYDGVGWKFKEIKIGGNNKYIACVHAGSLAGRVRDYAEFEANAKLLKAAPDLLKAAQYAVLCFGILDNVEDNRVQALHVLKAAIEKATK